MPQLTAEEEQWRRNGEILLERKNKHEKDHDKYMQLVQEGTPIDALPELRLPQPPPHPMPSMPVSICHS